MENRKAKNKNGGKAGKAGIPVKASRKLVDYNLGTSLRNYIDPRVFKAWMSYMNSDWARIYTSTLQRKFLWVDNISKKELSSFLPK